MLQRLFIQNYAIIDEITIEFDKGMNVITGETGAGKSIIVGALGLILGERADLSVFVNKEKKCIVEGFFDAEKRKPVMEFLAENELDVSDEIVIRREIASNGKSRTFINDTPVNLQQLQELSLLLVDLHQQFDTLVLAEGWFQADVLDALAGQVKKVEEYRALFYRLRELKAITEELKLRQIQFEKEADYHRFQFNELEEAAFAENELEEADNELKLLNSAEEIRTSLQKAYYVLSESEEPLVQQLKLLSNQLSAYASFHPDLAALVQRLQSTQVELQDIAEGLDRAGRHAHYDPERIQQLNERLSLGYKLLKKHGVRTTAELLAIREDLQSKLQAVSDVGQEVNEKEKQLAQLLNEADSLASVLSASRHKQVKTLESNVNKLLGQVGMPNARLQVTVTGAEGLNERGKDKVSFLFDANKSGQFQPLNKVASGGELSRLMLCIKSLVAKSIDLPTLIFDEIDSGISGEAARQVGLIMKDLSKRRQIISITHQPQIAGKADAHFFVYKEIINNNIRTNIRRLDMQERITSIAKMLSGEKPTVAAMENAREMLN